MEQWFRVSVIGRIREGVTREEVNGFMQAKMAEKGLQEENAVQWISIPSQAHERLYVKFSTVIPAENLDDAWNLRASKFFANAGYGDVAWKITPVEPNDPDCENTTCTIPADLFKSWLEGTEPDVTCKSPTPPEPFGSDQCWMWFEGFDE